MVPAYVMGGIVDLEDLDGSSIDVLDIARSLGRINRFAGRTCHPYSVAQHAVLVSLLVPERYALEALHHDDAEAFVGDMPKWIKRRCPEYQSLEAKVEAVIFAALGISTDDTSHGYVKRADNCALRLEQMNLQGRTEFFEWEALGEGGIETPESALDVLELELTPQKATLMYIRRHHEVVGK
jgi:hypothetical protein